MNEDIKKEWLEALRSGEYEQGRTFLCRQKDGKQEYCCLGVLSEIAVGHSVTTKEFFRIPDTINEGHFRFGDKSTGLAKDVQEWADIDSEHGYYGEDALDHLGTSLASDNDGGKTFEEIANIIEKEF